jgi:rfaE bifunctional protein nucleotidyltransferase chain/domain/rfaE bifunctional protein kinase chain/domain
VSGPLFVVGDALLDVDIDGAATRLAPDAPVPVVDVAGSQPRPGGAALAACLAAERYDGEVVLVAAVGSDADSDRLRRLLEGRVRLLELPLRGALPVKTRVRVGGRPLIRLDHGDGAPAFDDYDVDLSGAGAVLVADYGRGVAAGLRRVLSGAARSVPVLWDPHPRGGAPVPGARLVTPNASEASTAVAGLGHDGRDSGTAAHASLLAQAWQAGSVAITLGARGAVLSRGTASPMLLPAPFTAIGDPCGAGDCFAATAAVALAGGGLPEEAVAAAVAAASQFVADGGAGAWPASSRDVPTAQPIIAGLPPAAGTPGNAVALAEAVRARGGTVVATGGCFDLLHAGHVGLLEAARRAGDCLIVCLNSDASVERLKGPGRPLNTAADRARVLAGLGSVDAVLVFDEDTPERAIEALRPHLWVKGGDYTVEDLPEAAVLRSWGGEALVLPYLDGRSTTSLVRRAAQI